MPKPSQPTIGIFSASEFKVIPFPLDMACLLAKEGYQVKVIAPVAKKISEHYAKLGVEIRRLKMLRKGTARLKSLEFCIRAFFSSDKSYDVLIGVDAAGFLIAHLLKKLGRGKVLVYYALELTLPQESKRNFSAWYQARFSKDADIVISTGRERAKVMQEEFKLASLPLTIQNCLPYLEPGKSSSLREMLRKRKVEADFIAVYQGGISSGRYILEMIRSVKLWQPNSVLVIAGYDQENYAAKIREEIRKNELQRRVFYLGWIPGSRDELLKLTSGADLGLAFHNYRENKSFSSLYWTSAKLYEYLGCGLPVLVSDNPSLRLSQEDGFALCINPGEEEAIAAAVNRIISDRSLYQAMSENALRLFREKYNYQKQAEPFISKLKELIG
ncbi:MAG TPA: glycosyltransferase [Candidatus Omnitrophota bacterium]|nr:glycosyltransferase [Candidatus Omnitrophota bacterium]